MTIGRRTVDAIRFARNPVRVQSAPDVVLAESALLIAHAIVQIEERGRPELQVPAIALLDQAGHAIAEELRRRGLEQSHRQVGPAADLALSAQSLT